ncbi:MAG: DUF1579 family protein [Betaproteobacteria bacterium]|nr:DUF1579 family protein [Betaproteobacteria bacterium]
MALPAQFSALSGEWKGTKRLYLNGEDGPQKSSASRLTVAKAARGSFMMFAYTWSFDGDPHEGLAMLGYDEKQAVATAAWGDSWHMGSQIMHCRGRIDASGVFNVVGSYQAPPGPDWGWRIAIAPTGDDALRMVMHNIDPDGKEYLAVLAEFARQK